MATKPTPTNSSGTDDEISLKELILKTQEWWGYLLSKWRIILVFGLIGGVFGLLYAVIKKPVYTSKTTFVLEEGSGVNGLSQYAGVASMFGINVGGGDAGLFTGDNIIELYKSRNMIQKALLSKMSVGGQEQLLIDRFIEFNELRTGWEDDPLLKGISFKDTSRFTILQDSIIRDIVVDISDNYLSVNKPDKTLSIIEVQVKSEDELFSKAFSDELVRTVNDFYVELKTKKALENLTILQHQTDSVKAIMNGAIYKSAATMDATPNLNPTRQVLRSSVQQSQLNAEANKLILEELVKNLELSRMALRKETPLVQIIDKPILPLEKEEVGVIKGIGVGGFLFGFVTLFFLLLRVWYRDVMKK